MNDTTIVALATALGAIVAGFFTLRGAAKTAQPSAQDALNSGFTALTERQVGELMGLRTDVGALKVEMADCKQQLRDVSNQLNLSQRVISAAVWFIDRLVEWGQTGGSGPLPTPPDELHAHLSHPRWRNGA